MSNTWDDTRARVGVLGVERDRRAGTFGCDAHEPQPTRSVLVQGRDLSDVRALVESVGGEITHELDIIDAVAANLTREQIERVESSANVVRVESNRQALTASQKKKGTATTPKTKNADGKTPRGKSKTSASTTPEPDGATASLVDSGVAETTSTSFSDGWESELTALAGDMFSGNYDPFTELVDAPRVHDAGVTGRGVTVAVLDTGVFSWPELTGNEDFSTRVVGHYDAIGGRELNSLDGLDSDQNGHGTHLTSIVGSRELDSESRYSGIAPGVDLVVVKAFGAEGEGTYADVIRGHDWVVANKQRLGIRVLNLSFSAEARSHYWDDPVNQAVMKVWQAGIVVVASAGNAGPDPMTVGVPGNVPYVVTVGAMTDSYTPEDRADDRLTTFSSAGPTVERFVKPDVVAPGGHIKAMMDMFATVARTHPEFHDGWRYFTMSGTSQAAAVVTGVAALLLEREPGLSPDDVKCRLMAGSHPAVNADGTLAYSVFQQGAGLVNAYDAVFNTASGCANSGLDIEADLAGKAHFAGPARVDEDGGFYVEGLEEESLWTGSFLWNNSFLWSNSLAESIDSATWVEQE